MTSSRRRAWIAGALMLASLPFTAAPGSATSCGIGQGWDLFRTGTGTYYNPVADLLGDELSTPLTRVSFKGVPVGHHVFAGVGDLGTGPTDTIVQRAAPLPGPGAVGIELVALQLQADGLPGLGLSGDAPVYVTLQSQRGLGLLDPPAGPASSGVLNVAFSGCGAGTVHADFTVSFDVRVGTIDGPIVVSRSLALHTDATWGSTPPPVETENCHPHTIRTGVHCTLGPSILLDSVNVNVAGGDFYLGHEI
jgi:hypothetical protein